MGTMLLPAANGEMKVKAAFAIEEAHFKLMLTQFSNQALPLNICLRVQEAISPANFDSVSAEFVPALATARPTVAKM
jgi:hypothetical protein